MSDQVIRIKPTIFSVKMEPVRDVGINTHDFVVKKSRDDKNQNPPIAHNQHNSDAARSNYKMNDDSDGNDNENSVKIEKNKITINGSTIEYTDGDKDSVIINGKNILKKRLNK